MRPARIIFPVVLALAASTALAWSAHSIAANTPRREGAEPLGEPARAPHSGAWLAGVGVIEPAGEEIAAAAHRSGVVARVAVVEGASVAAGDVLFELDARAADAEVESRRAALAAAQARESEVASRAGPLASTVSAADAELVAARARLALARSEDLRARTLNDARALSDEERDRRANAVLVAESEVAALAARLEQVRVELALVTGGETPGAVLLAARAATEEARAELARTEVERDLLIVRAEMDAVVLAIDVRVGEYTSAAVLDVPAVVLGRRELHVRAEFAEEDASAFSGSAEAYASIRGTPGLRVPLTFVRSLPRYVPKRSLSGGAGERVDTRVLEVLYAIDAEVVGAAPGRRVDVFVAR